MEAGRNFAIVRTPPGGFAAEGRERNGYMLQKTLDNQGRAAVHFFIESATIIVRR